jgi:predicted  nucleic acid-binding Zn-ribbon protein
MLSDLKLILQLQGIDVRIGDLEREIAALPKHIAEIEKQLESHTRRLEADRAALVANQRDRKKHEGDIQSQEQKISKLRDQMQQAKTNDQFKAFQHEIEYCQQEIRKAEDRILDLMAASEPLDAAVKAAEVNLAKEKAQVSAEQVQARARSAADESQLAECRSERKQIVAAVSPALLRSYDRVRKRRSGVAVAEAVESGCTACHMTFRPQFFQELRKGDHIMYCESCGCILYYNPPVSLDDQIDATPGQASASTTAQA